jgi:oxygen-independent coproporphyrinogen-3 oxidase
VPDIYVEALCLDIQRYLPIGTSVSSVFMGGGTPSLLSVAQMERIVTTLQRAVIFDPALEFSVEVNPATVSLAWMEAVRALGVNRLSIGVQSFQDQALQVLGRRHSGADAVDCIAYARKAGFYNINVDMIFAIPDAPDGGCESGCIKADQEMIARLAPEHVSVYGFTLEPDTPFGVQAAQGTFTESDEDVFCRQFLAWHKKLHALGYRHYEISNYASSERECRHNLAYWERRASYGFGAGAHAFNETAWGVRSASAPDVARYVSAVQRGENPRQVMERFGPQEAMAEWVYLRLRTQKGVDEAEFRDVFGVEFAAVYASAIRNCGPALYCKAGWWYLPPHEWLLYNHYIQLFLP